ncbi:MAG: ABC transporter ATP-binding protein [Bacteroidota bacterium]
MGEKKEQSNKKGIPRLLEIAGKKQYHLLLSAVLAVLHAAVALVPYILVYYIIEQLLRPPIDQMAIQTYLLWAIGAGISSYGLLYASGLLSHVAAFNILYELRTSATAKLGELSLGFTQQHASGTWKKIVADDIERIEGFLAHQIPDFVKGITLPVVTIAYLFFVDWRLAAISFVPLLILAIWVPLMIRSQAIKDALKQHMESQEEMNATIVEFVKAMPVMKIFGQTASNFKKYSQSVHGFTDFSNAYTRKSAPPFAVFMSFMGNATLPILVLGTFLYLYSGLSIATLILFLILGVGYMKPVFALSNMSMQLYLISRGVERMDHILMHPSQKEQLGVAPIAHDIEFRQVDFAYEEEQKVLDKVSFFLPEHSITAFIGPSGAGKSTAAQLIARFWDIQEGSIRIGGVDIRDFSLDILMDKVAFVFQDVFMFHDTVFENIRMGMEKSEAEIMAAAKVAQCHTFIESLPQGYHTLLGQAGVYLSGGEQQRIQLARAILKDAPILVLDEATAFSDPENEVQIQQAVSQLIAQKTVVIIAHRLSTVVDADQIILFDRGKVVGTGTHQVLMSKSELYQKMWNAHLRAQEFAI